MTDQENRGQMYGLKHNGVTIYLGLLPGRKSLCFYFDKGTEIIPVAYVRRGLEAMAIRLWQELTGETE